MADAKYQLVSRIVRLSHADEWETALKEWKLERIYKTKDTMSCLCGHTPINNICVLRNTINNRSALVGNCCVKKFMGIPSDMIFTAVDRVSKDDSKSANHQSLQLARERNIISQWEYVFYMNTLNKRKLTPKQLDIRRKVNQKLLRLTQN